MAERGLTQPDDENIQRLEAAAGSAGPDLTVEVLRMATEGYPKQVIYALMTKLMLKLREEGRETEEDAAMDVMDCLVGWCAPSARLLPDEPLDLNTDLSD